MKTYGYVRVSSTDQNEDRQMDAMQALHIPRENIYLDKQSGKDFDRPQYQRMVKRLRPGDMLYLVSIDRLGRSYEEIQVQWRLLTKQIGVDIAVLDMPMLDTRQGKDLMGTFIADLALQFLAFFAQHERENIRRRQTEGIAAAKARGVRFGRPRRQLPEDFQRAYRAFRNNEMSVRRAAESCGMAASTFYSAVIRQEGADPTEL